MAEIQLMPSPHAEGAKILLDKIRALRAEIPRLTTTGLAKPQRFNAQASTPDSVLESTGVALETSGRLEAAAGVTGVAVRDALGFAISYAPCVREFFALARLMAHTIRVERAKAGAAALDVYAIAQRLIKQDEGSELLPFVQDVRQKLKAIRQSRRRKSDPVPAPDVQAASPAPSKK